MPSRECQSTPSSHRVRAAGLVGGALAIRLFAAALVCVLAGQACQALSPEEVLVVANANVPDSVALAKFYMQARSIPETNLALIRTTHWYAVSRSRYDREISAALRKTLLERKLAGKIRCLCLVWGVPVRVMGSENPGSPGAIRQAYRSGATKAQRRLALCRILLGSVGKQFPQPRTSQLEPVEDLFALPTPKPSGRQPKLSELLKSLDHRLATNRIEIGKLTNLAKRKIASRQLMAMHREIYGLRGLIRHIEQVQPPDAPASGDLKNKLAELQKDVAAIDKAKLDANKVKKKLALMGQIDGLARLVAYGVKQAGRIRPPRDDAAVDSELSLLWWPGYKISGMSRNRLHWRTKPLPPEMAAKVPPTLMTARIDGPTQQDAMRIVKDSVAVEKTGLTGVVYIDSGVARALKAKAPSYARYDLRLRSLYRFLRANTKLQVVLDRQETLFPPGRCPQAALYVGWYSLKRYVPAFSWQAGAVGWHVASLEASNLRNRDSTEWCAKMIQNGVAATVGAVQEPYLQSFPPPEEFFPLLLTGKWTLAECYWRTTPLTSWRMTLIGDPLYNPFSANPQLDPKVLPAGLAPAGGSASKAKE